MAARGPCRILPEILFDVQIVLVIIHGAGPWCTISYWSCMSEIDEIVM